MKDLVKETLDNQRKELQKNGTMPAADVPARVSKVIVIDLDGVPSKLPPALILDGVKVISKGEIATIVAQPGSGKTNVCEALVAAYLEAKDVSIGLDTLKFGFTPEHATDGKKVLWIDTERSPNDTLYSCERLRTRTNQIIGGGQLKKHVQFASFAEVETPAESLLELSILADSGQFDMILVDGVFDFCPDINNLEKASQLIRSLRAMAVRNDIVIVCTIHPNKGSDTISGHLGSTLYKFGRAVIYITCDNKTGIRTLTNEIGQGKLSFSSKPVNVSFNWNEESGIMQICDAPDTITAYNLDAVHAIFNGAITISSKIFKAEYGQKTRAKQATVNAHCQQMQHDGIIERIGNGSATYYKLKNHEVLPF